MAKLTTEEFIAAIKELSVLELNDLVKEYDCKKILIHYGGQSAVKSGLIDRVKASL